MTTAYRRAFRIWSFAMVAAAIPLLAGTGCPSNNQTDPLTVSAGPNQVIQSGSLMLQASVSGGSGIYNYSWTPATGLDSTDVLQPTFTAGAAGTYTFTLTVTDSLGTTASDSVTITVSPPGSTDNTDGNTTPAPGALVANAGLDKTTAIGSPVTLDGSASGGTAPYTYLWSPSIGLSNPKVAQPALTPSVSGIATYTLTVTDQLNATASDTVTVTVSASAGLTALTWGLDYSAGGYQIVAVFNKQLDPTTAGSTANYRINGSVNPASATLDASGTTLTLLFNTKLSSLSKLDIGVGGGLRDTMGGTVGPITNKTIGANLSDVTNPMPAALTWGADESSYTVLVTFTEAMDATSAENIHNYILQRVSPPESLQPTQAVLDASGMVVTLTFAGTIDGLRSSDLLKTSSEVRDINGRANGSSAGLPIQANSADVTGPTAAAENRVWGINQGNYRVSVTFNEVMDKTSAELTDNYSLGGNKPTGAALDPAGRTVVLTFETTTGGLNASDALTIKPDVRDINGQSNTSTAATPVNANLVDAAGPNLSPADSRVWGDNQASYLVILTFNEVVDKASATNVGNYTLAANSGAANVHPNSATLDSSGRIVTLDYANTTTGGLNRSDLLTVSAAVQDVNGRANVTTAPLSISSDPADTLAPTALSRTWGADGSAYQVVIVYSEVMDRLTTTTLTSYLMHGAGDTNLQRPTSVVLDATGTIATLTFESTGTLSGGFNSGDVLEIMNSVKDINGRGTSSITTVGANVLANPDDTAGPVLKQATFFQDPVNSPPPPPSTPGTLYWVDIVFSEALDKASAEAAAYSLTGTAAMSSVLLQPDGHTVRLNLDLSDPTATADGVDLTVPNTINDINGNPTAGGTVTIRTPVVVDAGPAIFMKLGQTVTLAATVTGGSGTYTYSWTPLTPALAPPDDLQPSFTPAAIGVFEFTLTATDSEGRTGSGSVTVSVSL